MVNSGNITKSSCFRLGAAGRLQDFRFIAGEVADRGVDLGEGNSHGDGRIEAQHTRAADGFQRESWTFPVVLPMNE